MLAPQKYARNNIAGTINLLNTMLAHDVKTMVFSSTAAVYGNPRYLPVDEKHPTEPTNFYGYTKLEIENTLEWYAQLKGLRYAALRYFNAAGYDVQGRISGREYNPANLLPLVMEVAAGERAELQIFGADYPTADGTGVRDYIHFNDLATAHLAALEYLSKNKDNLKINLATGQGYSVLEVVEAARRITGKEILVKIVGRRTGDPAELVATSRIAGELLGWQAQHSDLDTLLTSMWQIYNQQSS